MSERESVVAVFIRRVGGGKVSSQFYTVHGKWIHTQERNIQYSVPGWVDPKLIDPIIPHLPSEEVTQDLLEKAQFFDLSVPREYAAPLVARMLEFQRESDALYRKHASSLDGAHEMLAHPTELKFGTLEQIGRKLLGTPTFAKLSPIEMFTIRKAINRSGFAFGYDRRSHRVTGFIQIRSKDQVANVETVRRWIRQWQDDRVRQVASKNAGREDDREPTWSFGGRIVEDFLGKARRMIKKSRTTRQPSTRGNIGPLIKQTKTSEEHDATRDIYGEKYNTNDEQLLRFIEAWACANMFLGLQRLDALPPLLLLGTGMYGEHSADQATGLLCLQEMGVLAPYENRVRYDQHLLLPTSQHSRPLQRLMSRVLHMEKEDPGFHDSMEHLRKDWGDLPVFCIDDAGAREIDDGVSVEPAGNNEYWVHVHIAHPTAFFDRDHPLAKLSRHMTESIYLPEQTYSMMPRWATAGHFSLAPNKPCLTFSGRLNLDGQLLEHKITPGFVRNVISLTPKQSQEAVGQEDVVSKDVILWVGSPDQGDEVRSSQKKLDLSPKLVQDLKIMNKLASGRVRQRLSAGGVIMDLHKPEVTIHGRWGKHGLAWDLPSRKVARFSQSDPALAYHGKVFDGNVGQGAASHSDSSVMEMMLLACEIAAKWCAERNIPILQRGTVAVPDQALTPAESVFTNLRNAVQAGDDMPLHLVLSYLNQSGTTVLTTSPLSHKVLGLPNYAKATSPLRRYGDMMLHWQIDAALREEAATQSSLVGKKSHFDLPFSEANLKSIIPTLQPREKMIRSAMRYSDQHWLTTFFMRAFEYGECQLPATFQAHVFWEDAASEAMQQIILKELGCTVAMIKPANCGLPEHKAGDWWEVELEYIFTYRRTVLMRPIRLLSRYEGGIV